MNEQEAAKTSGRLTAEQLLEGRREDVETSLGTVTIRKLSLREVFSIGGNIIDVASMAGTEQEAEDLVKRKDARAATVMQSMSGIVRAGVVDPQLGDDPAKGPTADDFPLVDQVLLVKEIMRFAGFSKEAGEAIRPS
jgi:hypothetical protein